MNTSSIQSSYCPNSGCGKVLVAGPEGEKNWCADCYEGFDDDAILFGSIWRTMSLDERVRKIETIGTAAMELYRIDQRQYDDVVNLIQARGSSRTVLIADVSPDKAALPSLARGISDVGALREMIDNALDSAERSQLKTAVTILITFNVEDGVIVVRDNAGGMTESDILRCLRLGSVRKERDAANVIGRFGVGAKEAIYHFGREVIIRSRRVGTSDGLRVEIPEAWLDEQEWKVEVQATDGILPGSTEFRIGALNKFDFALDQIRKDLWDTYRKRIENGRLVIVVDDQELVGASDPKLVYVPELYPRTYLFQALGVYVDLSVCMMSDAPSASGVFFYASGRQFAHWYWNDQRVKMLFTKTPAHTVVTHFRVDMDFSGQIDDLPINANKDEIEPNRAFSLIARIADKLCRPYLDSVSWLSQVGQIRFVTDHYSGPENAHRDARIAPTPLDLGRVYDTIKLDRHLYADVDLFKSTMRAEIDAKSVPPIITHPPADPPVVDPPIVDHPVVGPKAGDPPVVSKPKHSLVAKARVDLRAADSASLTSFKDRMAEIGKQLNVRLVYHDD